MYPSSNAPTPLGSPEISQNQSNVCRLVRRNRNVVAGELKVKFTEASQHDRAATKVLLTRSAKAHAQSTVTIAQHGSIQAYIHNAAGKIA
jgi:hypothetical protein